MANSNNDTKSASESDSIFNLLQRKLENCRIRFHAHIQLLSVERQQEVAAVTHTDVIAAFLVMKPIWNLVETAQWDFVTDMLDIDYPEEVARYRELPEEDKVLLQRYVKFFLDCVKEINSA